MAEFHLYLDILILGVQNNPGIFSDTNFECAVQNDNLLFLGEHIGKLQEEAKILDKDYF